MATKSCNNKVTFRYFNQSGELLHEVTFRVRVSSKTANVSLVSRDDSAVSYCPSYNGDYYQRSRKRPTYLPGRLVLPAEGQTAVVYGGDEPSHGIHSFPREFAHLPFMQTNFIELTEAVYSSSLLLKMRAACKSARIKQDGENESWRRTMERNRYVGEQRVAMLEAHASINRLMNHPEACTTDAITKTDYLAACSSFYDIVEAFDKAQKRALIRWPENLDLPCPGDAGDLGEILLAASEEYEDNTTDEGEE